ncbi:uncharacterized protein CANTADRAFT_26134 [Suhomyces tanzawaensis NRRL Y-17324]|uniref:Membrane insertase YidC/Oxa/ALB C-terminal domain-containing protein n=1 Tax=Suhomyces tanzawaensis NRRL Y-17324 TaxID=984487 RepID=A0A1E4SHW5_9ASCO|nr:uncharacterized protein CANTADRAFT_26134 [Suhomyces tanzawaensis NRRL Y-17324]ODV79070.1 hypothetical protein CANTADRAFT_26134 [Suhomyces tanzawaensis NRRL Y-17324]
MLRIGLSTSVKAAKAFPRVQRGFLSTPLKTLGSSGRISSSFQAGGLRFNSTSSGEKFEIQNKLVSFDEPVEAEKIVSTLTSNEWGYLDSIGLAQGWGPTAFVERYLEAVHIFSGLPWWGTIAVSTVIARMILFPLYMSASSNGAKLAKVKPEMDEILSSLKKAESNQEKYVLVQDRKRLMKDNDIKFYKQVYPMLQLPIAYGFFQALRKMSAYPVEGFADQGYAWFENLTQVDPYLGLHGISAALILAIVRAGGETGQQQAMTAPMKKVLMLLPFLSIIITKDFYASVMIYVATNSLCSMVQTFVLRNGTFRKLFKMPPTTVNAPAPGKKQPETISDWFRQQKESFDEQVHSRTKETSRKLEAQVLRRRDGTDGFIKRHNK